MRIRAKFLIVFFAITLLPLFLLAYINFNSAKQALIEDARNKLETIAILQIARIHEAGMNPSSIKKIIADYSGLGQTGELIIARRGENGEIIYLAPRRFENFAKNQSPLMVEALRPHEGFSSEIVDYRGQNVVAVTRYLPDLGLGIVVKIDRDEAFQSIKAFQDTIVLFAFILTLFVVMVTLFFVHSITAPILNLASTAKKVRGGDLSKRAIVQTNDEIGDLSSSFNAMVDALEESHKNLEEKVHKRTQQLETANKDLESFSYSVSHDLRAPLRAIDGFSQVLDEDYGGKVGEDGRQVIAKIRHSTNQMGRLIDDLLTFSRLGRKPIEKQLIDMTALAKEVFEEQKLASPDRKIEFTCAKLPSAYGDPSLMRQVWVNLLSNAIKFSKKKELAAIIVDGAREDTMIIYSVKDNGVGFDMKYVDKLFGVFQRLHDPEEFEGTGVGLAIVARIIGKHGGKAWAEGKVDKGATFYFSLPSKLDNQIVTM